jgi:hypothetical protein
MEDSMPLPANMPAHLVEADIAQGRLKVIWPVEFDARTAQLVMCGAYLASAQVHPERA